MEIKAAVAYGPHTAMLLETLQLEEPLADEILVRVVATGICHTDIGMRDQQLPTPLPAVLGHEGAGVVERVGAGVTKVRPGDHVVMTFNSCGHCPSCFDGQASYCHEFFPRNFFGKRPDGSSALSRNGAMIHANIFGQSSFASHAICNERNVVKVPHNAPLELLGPLACGIQTGAGAVLNALKVKPGKSLAVFGVGTVGMSAVMAGRIAGATTIIAIDVNDERLALAMELGATHVFNANSECLVERILETANHIGLDYTLDATGIASVIEQAVAVLAPRGCCGIVGAPLPGTTIQLDLMHLMASGRQVRGIVEGDANADTFIPALIRLYQLGQFPFDRLVRYYEFSDINQALHDAESGLVLKPIVRQP